MSARFNCYASSYSWIAFTNYADAEKEFEKLSQDGLDISEIIFLESKLSQHIFITVTFAAMAIESFLNDYIAMHLGDEFFNNHFSSLSTVNKLQLVSEFMLSGRLDKGKQPYQAVYVLFRTRNDFVHNKSQNAFDIMEKMMNPKNNSEKNNSKPVLDTPENERKKAFQKATEAIDALCKLASYFNKEDSDSTARFQLTWASAAGEYDPEEVAKVQRIQKKYHIAPCIAL